MKKYLWGNNLEAVLKEPACWALALWLLFFLVILPGCCDEDDHTATQEDIHQVNEQPEPEPNYRYELGDLVEHYLHGQAAINERRSGDPLPIYKIWYKTESGGQGVIEAFENEIKPLDLPDYPKPEPKHNLERDLEIQMMEERIEKKLLEKLETDK